MDAARVPSASYGLGLVRAPRPAWDGGHLKGQKPGKATSVRRCVPGYRPRCRPCSHSVSATVLPSRPSAGFWHGAVIQRLAGR
jgi:hypothetical protein